MRVKNRSSKFLWILVLLLILAFSFLAFINGILSNNFAVTYDVANTLGTTSVGNFSNDQKEIDGTFGNDLPTYVSTPSSTKAIYMTACVASTVDFKSQLVKLIDETEINSIIIDIKDFTGTISFDTGNNLEGEGGTGCRVSDMKEFVAELHRKGIYVIGRVTVFQDPFYSKLHPELAVQKASDGTIWKDHKGLSFIDVGAKDYWDYIIELAKRSHQIGFDEINFDYIRFPSDGNMKDIYFSHVANILEENPSLGKQIALENFFKYLKDEIDEYNVEAVKEGRQKMITSADIFGMTTTSYDDLNIGQVLERTLPYFDFIAPMVYPSHYPPHFNGWTDPNKVPYELIYFVMKSAHDRVLAMKANPEIHEEVRNFISTDQLRPWIQDFDYGGNYGPEEVRAQIKATYDVGLDSWMIWAPSNIYTREALRDK